MILTVPLQSGTTLANVAYRWIASGVIGSQLTAGITQPSASWPQFRISATPPAGAEALIVYDVTDLGNWNDGGYATAYIRDNLPTAQAVTDAVWDEPIAGHLDAGSTGLKLNSAAAAGDPWSTTLPGAYADHEAGKILSKLDVPPPDEFVVVIPAPEDVSQCACYIVTRDGHGAIQTGVTLTFSLVGAPVRDSYNTGAMTAVSDDNGVCSINLRRLARYDGRRGLNTIARFDVPDSDTFSLPQVLGNP